MFDDLRDQAASSPYFQDDDSFLEETEAEEPGKAVPVVRGPSKRILGMTAVQRFVISVMLFLMVCVLGMMVLLVLERIRLPL